MGNGLPAEREGYDVFVLGTNFDSGLHELRELLNILVLGLCESSIYIACLMGATFSLINVNPMTRRRPRSPTSLRNVQSLEQGAEVLVPAGETLIAVLADAGVHQIDSAPVLDGLIAVIKVAEIAVAIAAALGRRAGAKRRSWQ